MFKYKHTSTILMLVLLLSTVVLVSCSKKNQSITSSATVPGTSAVSSKISKTTVPTSTHKSTSTTTTSAGTIIKLKKISFVDSQGIGTEAFSVLIPSDWQYEGGVKWILDSPIMPAIAQCRVWNPKGTEELQGFPDQLFFWTANQLILAITPPGSRYFGGEVKAPITASQALKEIVIPKFRNNVQGLRIINEQNVTDITQSANSQSSVLQNSIEAAKVRVEYIENGKTMEDDISCAVETLIMGDSTWWWVKYGFSVRAEKGKLDANDKIFQTICRSVRPNLQWFNTYNQIVYYLIQMQIKQIKSVGELGSIIAQTGSEIRQENLDLYNQRQTINDKISDEFSRYIRNVDNYYNPLEGKNVELPTGYDNVWVNNLGEYVLTDNPNYNPNIGNNQNFQRLDKAK